MRPQRLAVLGAFGGGATALLGLAWDVSIHTANPGLAAHETPIDVLSPPHDLIALGILVSAACGAWAVGEAVDRRLGILAIVAVLVSTGWLAYTVVDPPPLPAGTPSQQAAADALWSSTLRATARYSSLSAARAAGYLPVNPFGDELVHYVNPTYMHDGLILDPEHVEFLVYESTLRGPVLVAAMYSLESADAMPPDVAGPLTPWHRHTDLCFTSDGEPVGTAPDCPAGSATYLTPLMLHVWFVPNRYGRFAADLDPWNQVAVQLIG